MDGSWIRGGSLVLFGYFLGSVPFGILVTRLFDRNVNLRETGSGNIGATNVARTAGKAAGILTLALDVGKGIFPMVLTYMLVGEDFFWPSLVRTVALSIEISPAHLPGARHAFARR